MKVCLYKTDIKKILWRWKWKKTSFVLFYSSVFILHKTHLYFFFAQGWVTIGDTVHVMETTSQILSFWSCHPRGQQHQQLYIYLAHHSLHLRLWISPLALALGNRYLCSWQLYRNCKNCAWGWRTKHQGPSLIATIPLMHTVCLIYVLYLPLQHVQSIILINF